MERFMKTILIKSIVIVVSLSVSSVMFARELARTDRYTLVSMEATSDQAKPLSTITSVSLGRDVDSVGDGINELLKGSGYRWQSQDNADQLLNDLPLPAVVRTMGPIRLSDALQTLAGEAWVLRTDNLNRVVWFEVNQKSLKKRNN
jgi:conjugative transfer region protein (TIGR03748 family)